MEARRHLSDVRFYQCLNQDCTKKSQQTVKSVVHDLISTCELPPTASNLIVTSPRTSQFYLLPKIHKPNHPGCPIVSACSCPTENISAYLDEVMAPLVRGLSSYVKDTNHALQIFDSFHFDPMDIKSLYTVIPNDCGPFPRQTTCSSTCDIHLDPTCRACINSSLSMARFTDM